jgi:hypothetical protein
MPLLLM